MAWDPVTEQGTRLGSFGASWSEEEDLDYCYFAVLDERRVVRSGTDGRLLLWDLTAPDSPIEIGICGEEDVFAVAALDEGTLISASDDGRVLLWDVSHPGAPIFEFTQGATPDSFAVLADGRAASGERNGRVAIWDPVAQTMTELGRHDEWVKAVGALADGRLSAAVMMDECCSGILPIRASRTTSCRCTPTQWRRRPSSERARSCCYSPPRDKASRCGPRRTPARLG
jgi:WD40 repeat protein